MKVELRRHQHRDADGNPIKLDNSSGTIQYVSGTIDDTWIDVTNDVENIDTFQFSERIGENGQKQREKGSTTQLTFGFEAYALIIDWLTSTEYSFLNYFDVRITDTDLNYVFKLYELKPDNIELCEDDGCQVTVPLRESDQLKSVLETISIHDNWQGWFQNDSVKEFPQMQVFTHLTAMAKAFTLGAMAVISILNVGLGALGIDINELTRKTYGFGRFLPTPFVRDILENAMAKIGYTIDTPFDIGEVAENDVLVYSNGIYHTNFGDKKATSPSQSFLFENRLIWSLDSFLDEICKLYNFVWQVVDNKLIITPIKDVDNATPVFEISDDVYSDCKTFSFEKNKAGASYEYQKDGTDSGSSETINQYNDIVSFNVKANNPILSGLLEKQFRFASTSFWGDGFGENIGESISDFAKIVLFMISLTLTSVSISFIAVPLTTAQAVVIGTIAVTVITGGIIWINDLQKQTEFGTGGYYKHAIKVIGTGSIFTPRIIRTDPTSPMNYKHPVTQLSSTIVINPKYNLNGVAWKNQWNGHGDFNEVYNFPLFFDANYIGTLFDEHEQTDNSVLSQQTNEQRTIVVGLCETYLNFTGINNDNDNCIGKVILYKGNTYRVLAVDIKYDSLTIEFKLKRIKTLT